MPSFTLYFHFNLPSARLTAISSDVSRAHIDGAVDDRGGGLNGIPGLESPEQLKRFRNGGSGDAGEAGIAAKLRPVVGRVQRKRHRLQRATRTERLIRASVNLERRRGIEHARVEFAGPLRARFLGKTRQSFFGNLRVAQG